MRYTNSRFGSRRRTSNMPIVPFKDSNGATVWADRRKMCDRRMCKIQSEQNLEAVVREVGHT
jgi:hypothetical protein